MITVLVTKDKDTLLLTAKSLAFTMTKAMPLTATEDEINQAKIQLSAKLEAYLNKSKLVKALTNPS